MSTVQGLAGEAFACFETVLRGADDDSSSSFVRVREGSPSWVTDVVREAHDGMLPDDRLYALVMYACEHIALSDDPADADGEFADCQVDDYSSDLVAWLASHPRRFDLVDEALHDLRYELRDGDAFASLLRLAQYEEAFRVYGCVLGCLAGRVGVSS